MKIDTKTLIMSLGTNYVVPKIHELSHLHYGEEYAANSCVLNQCGK